MKGILGRKAGMTTVFSEEGRAIPVTVVEVKPNIVLQVKTNQTDGYDALQLGVEDKKVSHAIKSEIGIANKANTEAKYFVKEIKGKSSYNRGDVVDLSIFTIGEYVDVTGISKGKGFQGAIKRHGQSRGPMAHGSKSHRVTGSLGSITGTVKKTKKMPGHMGTDQVTMQNLEIVGINIKDNYLLIKGSIPGPNKSFVEVRQAIKKTDQLVKHPVKLANVKETEIKNNLLEEAKHYGAALTSEMSILEMENQIAEAKVRHHQDLEDFKILTEQAKQFKISNYGKMKLPELREAVQKAIMIEKNRNSEGE